MGKYTKVKLILLGDTYTGKSSILSMYKNNLRQAKKDMSISISFRKETDISRGDILTSSKTLITQERNHCT